MKPVLRSIICLGLLAGSAQAERLVDQLMAQYAKIESVQCDIRRDVANEDGQMRWLSRVYFQQGDRLHVENFSPLPRRIIADGQTMFQHNEGQPRGFRRPIVELNETMQQGLRRVPGTLMDHLFRIGDAEEEVLPDGDDAFPIRRGYATESIYAVLHVDDDLRLGRLELFDAHDHEKRTGVIECESFIEAAPGVWIALIHRGRFQLGGMENSETTRITNYAANTPLADHLFNADAFFRDVRWVSRFEDL